MTGALDGRVAVVTGAARGIGAELARVLTARGARVACLGLEPEQLRRVSASLPGSTVHDVDVTDGAALAAVAQQVVDSHGRVDVVVANAGVAVGGPLLGSDPEAYDRVLEVNLLGSVRTVRAFLPAVVDSRGYVLQIASLAAMAPAPMMSAYCASKSGVEAFARSVRAEVQPYGVEVGVAYLSWTDTDMVRTADAQPGVAEARAALPGVLGRTYPLGPSVERLADGIERRRASVYGQGWVRAVQPLRPLLPALVALGARLRPGDLARAEQAAALSTAALSTAAPRNTPGTTPAAQSTAASRVT